MLIVNQICIDILIQAETDMEEKKLTILTIS